MSFDRNSLANLMFRALSIATSDERSDKPFANGAIGETSFLKFRLGQCLNEYGNFSADTIAGDLEFDLAQETVKYDEEESYEIDLAFGLPSEQQGQHHLHQVLYFRKREPIPNAMLM
jgi:hypothetical protein